MLSAAVENSKSSIANSEYMKTIKAKTSRSIQEMSQTSYRTRWFHLGVEEREWLG